MAQRLVYVAGVSHRGFRVKDNAGAWKVCKFKATNIQVDLNDDSTKKILTRERGNFVVAAASGTTTFNLKGLQGVAAAPEGGLRVRRSSDSARKTLYQGGAGQLVNLADGRVARILRRSPGCWVRLVNVTDTRVKIRGLQSAQLGFLVPNPATAVLTSTNVQVTTNDTVTIDGTVYTFKATLTEVRATATLTSDQTNVTDNDTVTINDKTYRFKGTMALANDVQIDGGGSADASLANLVAAVNLSGTPGTEYFAGTTAPTGVTAAAVASHATVLKAAVGTGTAANAWASTETSTHLSFGSTHFVGGVNPVANQVHLVTNADTSLGNLVKAINASGVVGTDYSTGTTANPGSVTAGTVTSHATTLTADTTRVALSTTAVTLSFNAVSAGGATSVVEGVSVTVDLTVPKVRALLRRHYRSWVEDTN